jgi:hypothetical protein
MANGLYLPNCADNTTVAARPANGRLVTMIDARIVAHLQLSAASGLVVDGASLWVIADDVPALHRYDLEGRLLERIPLEGDNQVADRPLPKPVKRDLEALLMLPGGDLFALGSGSRPHRCRAFLIDRRRTVRMIDLSPLYTSLAGSLPALNVEGGIVLGEELVLAHRGVDGRNALIRLQLDEALAALSHGCIAGNVLRGIQSLQLGQLEGTPLTLTDLAMHPDGTLWFSAAAEATTDPYLDGVVRGSVIGSLDAEARVQRLEAIRPALKIEGLHWISATGSGNRWLAVADADDLRQRAPLLELISS